MALAVLMFTSIAGTEQDRKVRVDDPIGPQLLKWSDGVYSIGKHNALNSRLVHPLFRRALERSDPGAYGFMTARLVHMDDVVRQEAAAGLDQLVILGAGYDTRAYRMQDDLVDVRVFEVDVPAMSEDKRSRLEGALGSVPGDVEYLEVDFTHDHLFERLNGHGYDESARTLFVLCGVSMYLPEKTILELFSQVAAHSADGSSIVFDYVFDDMLTAPERHPGAAKWIERARAAGEELRFGVSPDRIGEILSGGGLNFASQADMPELAERYLRRGDGTMMAEPYGFAAVARAVVGA
ncbi:MAG TPA: SAM-dependent methyltransferase [Hyphomicrobiaceae bacterium]|nr:SAM-dependent methyltransferase [Hyphomicrobiaceae bacterium]